MLKNIWLFLDNKKIDYNYLASGTIQVEIRTKWGTTFIEYKNHRVAHQSLPPYGIHLIDQALYNSFY